MLWFEQQEAAVWGDRVTDDGPEWDTDESLESSADEKEVEVGFVVNGLGAPMGMEERQHFEWASAQGRVAPVKEVQFEPEILLAVQYELGNEPEAVDNFRKAKLKEFLVRAADLRTEKLAWKESCPEAVRSVAGELNGPVLEWMLEAVQYPDDRLVNDCRRGFPFVGKLPCCFRGAKPVQPQESSLTIRDALEELRARNERILESCVQTELSGDIWDQTQKDIDEGFMSPLVPVESLDLGEVALARRMGVREVKSTGEAEVRIVDHMTENSVNCITDPSDTVYHEGVDVQTQLLGFLLRAGKVPKQWKRDVSKAFRRIPLAAHHQRWAYVVFRHEGRLVASRHVGMPFGSTSAVYGWHRYGGSVATFMRTWFRLAMARYVDDFFGVGVAGCQLAPGLLVDVVLKVLGTPTDPKKSVDFADVMVVLGVQVSATADAVLACVPPDKAAKWRKVLEAVVKDGKMTASDAGKMAGRLAFATSATGGRQGRAYVKPFYCQQHAPQPNNRATPLLVMAAGWWEKYLAIGPEVRIPVRGGGRQWVLALTDAAGTGLCCAVLRVGGSVSLG